MTEKERDEAVNTIYNAILAVARDHSKETEIPGMFTPLQLDDVAFGVATVLAAVLEKAVEQVDVLREQLAARIK